MKIVLNKMLENTLKSIKGFIITYIETYQSSLNTTNPDFILELVKSSDVIQGAFVSTSVTNKKGLSNDEFLRAEEERIKQLFKQILSGVNDLDETLESSKQVKLHRNLTRCYFDFIRKNVRDFVPKHIIYKMVNHVLNNIDHYMHDFVFTPNNRSIDLVLAEEGNIVENRIRAEQMLNAVNKGLKTMMDIQCV